MNIPNNYPVPAGPMQPSPNLIPWCYAIGHDMENEKWYDGGYSREECIAAALREISAREKEDGVKIYDLCAIAPCRRATQSDVDDWSGDDDLDLGAWMIDEGKEEDLIRPDDELLPFALTALKENRRAGVATLQRRLRIGYNHAFYLMTQLELKGIVGKENGSSPREILVDLDTYQLGS